MTEPHRFFIESAITTGRQLLLVGWVNDSVAPVSCAIVEGAEGRGTAYTLNGHAAGAKWTRTLRPDVHQGLGLGRHIGTHLGFVMSLPAGLKAGDGANIAFDVPGASPQTLIAQDIETGGHGLTDLLIHSGYALRDLAASIDAINVVEWIDRANRGRRATVSRKVVAVDHALVFAGRVLLLHGWIGARPDNVKTLRIRTRDQVIDAATTSAPVYRPDLFPAFPELAPLPLGFFCLVDTPGACNGVEFTLEVETSGGWQAVRFTTETASWSEVLSKLKQSPHLRAPMLRALRDSAALRSLPGHAEDIDWIDRESLASIVGSLPRSVQNPFSTLCSIDRVIALGKSGLLAVGWHHEPHTRLSSATIIAMDGKEIDVTDRLVHFPRNDVFDTLKSRFPNARETCGFMFCASVPPTAGTNCALRLAFENGCDEWLPLLATESVQNADELLRILAASLIDLNRLDRSVFDFFESGFGTALTGLSTRRCPTSQELAVRQFGEAPASPDVSVIVPLYGRCDFVRYQLAHFVDDPDFSRVDLVYVVDDPRIGAETLALAHHYAGLFGVPFRVVSYNQNLGYAGANNVGASLARAPTLLLLNSDVIPSHPGWVRVLEQALDNLPNACAVGPLLLFADGSIQHAGMKAVRDPAFPGYLLNSHPRKGTRWREGDEPFPQPLLTAACLMMRLDDYLSSGGLDEGYLVGDFEDSDLCLKLRRSGKKLWVVPSARLWHLERQSQDLGTLPTERRLLTLYNGWLYKKRIDRGELTDPTAT
jgi:O-antigen biosynthesis protein